MLPDSAKGIPAPHFPGNRGNYDSFILGRALIEAANYNHFEMMESVGNPYGPNGRAVLAMMKLNAA